MNCIFPIFSQLGWLFGWLTPFSPTDPLDPGPLGPLGPLCQANGADHGSAQPFGQRVRKAWWCAKKYGRSQNHTVVLVCR